MKNLVRVLFIIAAIALTSIAASAQTSQFIGKFKNIDAATAGNTTLEITGGGSVVKVHAWGKCSPSDCDWGTVPGYVYSGSAGTDPTTGGKAVSANFVTGFNETIMIIRPYGKKNYLTVDVYTRFTDTSGRFAYTNTYTFKKV